MTDCKCGCHISKIFPNTQCGKCYSDPCSHYKNWSTGKLTFVPDPLSDRIEALEKRVDEMERLAEFNMSESTRQIMNMGFAECKRRIESLEQQVKDRGESKPHKCSVCEGKMFYPSPLFKCQVCKGKGVLWS